MIMVNREFLANQNVDETSSLLDLVQNISLNSIMKKLIILTTLSIIAIKIIRSALLVVRAHQEF